MSTNIKIEVRDSVPEKVYVSELDLADLSESELSDLEHFPCAPHVPVYLDYGQSSKFTSHSWTITGPSGYTQSSPQKTTTSFVFKFVLPGKYKAVLTAAYSDTSNPANNWSEQATFRFIVKEKVPYFEKFPDMDFIQELLPSFYSLVGNTGFLKNIWSSAGSLVAQELLSSIEIDQCKSINTFPDYFQKKWAEYHPEMSLEDIDFRSFYLLKPIKDSNVVIPSSSTVITPSDFSLFSQVTSANRTDFTVKDYNSLTIQNPTASLQSQVFKISSGPETGFTFRIETINKSSVTISPKLPGTLAVDTIVNAEASSQVGTSGLIVLFTENSTGVEHLRVLTSVLKSQEQLVVSSPVPSGTYTVEIMSILKSFSSLEEKGVSPGDRLLIDVFRGETASATIPVEIYKVLGNTAALRVELSPGLSFSDAALFLLFTNLNYPGSSIDSSGVLEFSQEQEVLTTGEIVDVLSEAETLYESLKYPPEALNFEIFETTVLNIGDIFSGRIRPKYIVRNTKVPKPESLSSLPELRDHLKKQVEFLEDGFVKSVDSEGSVFIKPHKSMTLLEGVDFTLDDEDFIQLNGFNYSNPAPRKLWAPLSLYSTETKLENSFAKAGDLTFLEYQELTSTLSYRQVLQGLMYSYSEGPTLESVEIGLHLLLDIPIVTEPSIVQIMAQEVNSQHHYRVLNQRTLEVRDMFLPKREYTDPRFSERGINRITKDLIEEGDLVPQFSPLVQFIKVDDNIGNSKRPQDIHRWTALVDASVVATKLIPKTKRYLDSIKPAHTTLDFVFVLFLVDTVEISIANIELDLKYIFLDTIGPYQSERSVDSWAHGAILRRFDSASYTLRTYSYGRGLQVTQTNLVDPNANPEYHNPFLSSDTEIRHPLFGTSDIDTDSSDSVQAGDFLVLTTGINQGVYEIDTVHSNGTWSVSPATDETDSDAVADLDYVDFYVVRLDSNSTTDSDDDWEELSPQDVPSFDMNFGSATVSGSSGTLTHSALASGSTFEVLNVRAGDIIIIDSVEHDIISVSGSSITIQNQDTFTSKQFVIRRFL